MQRANTKRILRLRHRRYRSQQCRKMARQKTRRQPIDTESTDTQGTVRQIVRISNNDAIDLPQSSCTPTSTNQHCTSWSDLHDKILHDPLN